MKGKAKDATMEHKRIERVCVITSKVLGRYDSITAAAKQLANEQIAFKFLDYFLQFVR